MGLGIAYFALLIALVVFGLILFFAVLSFIFAVPRELKLMNLTLSRIETDLSALAQIQADKADEDID